MKDMDELELSIAKFLRAGVFVASILLGLCWLAQIQFHSNPLEIYRDYVPRSLPLLLNDAYTAKDWEVLIGFAGLFVLISLPALRVLLTMVIFFKQKEYVMAGIAAFVISVIGLSLLLGWEIH